MNTLFRGVVTHVIDPSSFWMKIGTEHHFQTHREYQIKLDHIFNGLSEETMDIESLQEGSFVVVNENTPSSHWKRAQIARTDVAANEVDVFYIDMGHTEIVDVCRIRPVDTERIPWLPCEAIRCGLAGIKPLSKQWTGKTTNRFKTLVLNQEVCVCVHELDQLAVFCKVELYFRAPEGDWTSLSCQMCEEFLGLPTENKFPQILTQETVDEYLRNAEAGSALEEGDNGDDQEAAIIDTRDDEVDVSENEDSSSDEIEENTTAFAKPEPEDEFKRVSSLHLPSPADFLATSSSEPSTGASTSTPLEGLMGFDLQPLAMTTTISISKMQADKDSEVKAKTRKGIESDINGLEDVEDDDELVWGISDRLLGIPDAHEDIHEEISKEIHPDFNSESNYDDDIDKELPKVGEPLSWKEVSTKTETQKPTEAERTLPFQLSEIKAYELEKSIEEILEKNCEDPELMCALINSLVEPDIEMSTDHLTSVITAVLEWLVKHPDLDSQIFLDVLNSYSNADTFEATFVKVLKDLKQKFVKLSQSIRSMGRNQTAFAQLLASIMTDSLKWTTSAFDVQKFILSTVDTWAVFNIQRQQEGESFENTELMYLECLELFILKTHQILATHFEDKLKSLLVVIREKLLNDSTCSWMRGMLLDLLLRVSAVGIPVLVANKLSGVNVATQTDERNRYSSGQHIPTSIRETETPFSQSMLTKERSDVSFLGNGWKTSPLTYPAQGTSIVEERTPDSVAFSPENRPSNITDKKFEYHNLHKTLSETSEPSPTQTKIYGEQDSSAYSTSGTESLFSLPHGPSESSTSFFSVGSHLSSASTETPQTGSPAVAETEKTRRRGVPKTIRRLPPRLLKKYLQEHYQEDGSLEGVETGDSDNSGMNNLLHEQDISLSLPLGVKVRSEDEECSSAETVTNPESEVENVGGDIENASLFRRPVILIQYSSEELKALNPNRSKPPGHLDCLEEPWELLPFVNTSSPPEKAETGEPRQPASRYAVVETELSNLIPKLNPASFQKLSTLLPESHLKPKTFTLEGSSVDPPSRSSLGSDNLNWRSRDSEETSVENKPAPTLEGAGDLLPEAFQIPSKQSFPLAGNTNVNNNNLSTSFCSDDNTSNNKDNDSESVEIWHTEESDAEEMNSLKFQSQGEGHQSESQVTGSKTSGKGKKKKKTKFKPFNLFYEEQKSNIYDEFGFENDDISDEWQDFDELTEEAEHLQIAKGENFKGHIIHEPQQGIHTDRTTKSSLFSEVHKQEKTPKEPWLPGQRNCSRCGSNKHIVYNCPQLQQNML